VALALQAQKLPSDVAQPVIEEIGEIPGDIRAKIS